MYCLCSTFCRRRAGAFGRCVAIFFATCCPLRRAIRFMPLQERLSPFMHLARPGATPMEMECDALCGAGKLQDLKAQFSFSFLPDGVGASQELTAYSLRNNKIGRATCRERMCHYG